VLAIDFRRGRAHSTVRSIALHTVCGVSRVDRVISTVYPLYYSRHNTKDRSLGVGRDIIMSNALLEIRYATLR